MRLIRYALLVVFHAQAWHAFILTMENRKHQTATGEGYAFFSGIGSDLTEVLALGVFVTWVHNRNCHVQGCWRLSWKQWVDPDGHTHALCRRHHPHDAPTADQIAERAGRE